jgi:hypothetical protein
MSLLNKTVVLFIKIEAVLAVSIPLSLLKQLFEKYIFSDWQFLYFLFVAIGLDTFFGVWKNIKYCTLSAKGFGGLFTKVTIYFGFLIVTHTMVYYSVQGKQNVFFSWFDSFAYSAIMVREAISIIEKIGAINPNLIPGFILKRLKQFDSDGKFESTPTNDEPV